MTDQPRDYINAQVREYERQRIIERMLRWILVIAVLLFCVYAWDAHGATKHDVKYTESLYKGTSKIQDVVSVTSEADAHYQCKKLAHDLGEKQTVAATFRCQNAVTTDSVTIVPDPVVTTVLQFTATYGIAYKPLQGATVSGKVNVALSDCTVIGDWTFFLDGVQLNVESGCPYEFLGDGMMWDSATVANGSHTLEARGSKSITATFTVSNAVPTVGSVTLTWPLVTQNTDNSAYVDPFGYVIYYGPTLALPQSIDVNDPKATKYVVSGLSLGHTYYFCIRARNTSNVRSDCSPVVSKTL
jgi:hypothetical protein